MLSILRAISAPIQPVRLSRYRDRALKLFTFSLLAFSLTNLAEAQKQRLSGPVVEGRRVVLSGHVHPNARPENDRGAVDPAFRLEHITLTFKRTPEQQADLEQLLAQQQNPSSPQFHRWLTPQDFAGRFGLNASDVSKVTSWLESNGFTVKDIAPSRTFVVFSGSAQQVEQSLHTSIRRYNSNGEDFYANQVDPSVPEKLAQVVLGFHGLNNVRLRHGQPERFSKVVSPQSILPGSSVNTLGPKDFSTIYNLGPLAQRGLTGTGQSIAVLGESSRFTQIASDTAAFRQYVGLPAKAITFYDVDHFADNTTGVRDEANLDVQWAGAIAPNADIHFYRAYDVFDAAQYVVANNLAPVMSFSFGACEGAVDPAELDSVRSTAQQASSQGITWIVSTGDDGAYPSFAGCGLSAEFPASVPEVTGVGGTQFAEAGGSYWTAAGALSYIPEVAWNDGVGASGGGISTYYKQPAWQNGIAAGDGFRHVPDIALSASASHDPYFIVSGGQTLRIGGTSAGTPSFAAIVALLNQQSGPQGNINPSLYSLYTSVPSAFHDITSGNNFHYYAGPGYDEVTGLGSVDASNLITNWKRPALPVLTITALTAPTTVLAGNNINISVTVANQGTANAGAFRLAEYLSTSSALPTATLPYIHYCDITGLAAGATTTCTAPVNVSSGLTPGTYYLSALADISGQIQQASKGGNARLADSGSLTVTGSSCSFALPVTQATATVTGGAGSFTVTSASGCSWTATSSASWLMVTAASGSGSGTVSYQAAVNAGVARSSVVNVTGGLSFTVSQSGVAPVVPPATGLRLIPVTSCRIVDTRTAPGTFGGPSLGAAQTRSFAVPQSSCGIPSVAAAYSLNITVVPKGSLGYLTVWPTGQAQPLVSTLNALSGGAVANAAIIPAGTGGAISVYATDSTDVIIDVNGYFAPATYTPPGGLSLVFHPIAPCRLADTRGGQGATGAFGTPSLTAGVARDLPVPAGRCSVPTTAQAYSVNVTAVPQGPLYFLTLWPSGQPQPLVSTLNAFSGQVTANAAIVPAGANGGISLYASNTTDVIVDVNGYFSPPDATQGYLLYPVTPCRVVDTRFGQGTSGAFGPPSLAASSRDMPIPAGRCTGVPANAQAYALNATVVPSGPLGYLTLWPTGQTQPGVSTLNSYNGVVVANAAIVPAGTNGAVSAYASSLTDLLLDINAYFAP